MRAGGRTGSRGHLWHLRSEVGLAKIMVSLAPLIPIVKEAAFLLNGRNASRKRGTLTGMSWVDLSLLYSQDRLTPERPIESVNSLNGSSYHQLQHARGWERS